MPKLQSSCLTKIPMIQKYKWMQNVRGYYDRGKLSVIQVAITLVIFQSVRSANKREGDGVKRVDGRNKYVLLFLENIKIWCYIQITIYPFIYNNKDSPGSFPGNCPVQMMEPEFLSELSVHYLEARILGTGARTRRVGWATRNL